MNLDVVNDGKPVLKLKHADDNTRQPQPKITKLRRFMSIGSRSRSGAVLSKHNTSTELDSTVSMQNLSPRPIESETRPKTQPMRSISNFLLRTSANASESVEDGESVHTARVHVHVTKPFSGKLPPPFEQGKEECLRRQGHLPLTGNPCQPLQMQPRKDSAIKSFYDLPTAASRSAALTSHPVGKEEAAESEDECPTPGEFWGRKKG